MEFEHFAETPYPSLIALRGSFSLRHRGYGFRFGEFVRMQQNQQPAHLFHSIETSAIFAESDNGQQHNNLAQVDGARGNNVEQAVNNNDAHEEGQMKNAEDDTEADDME